jgi:hypothetical protein
VAALGSVTGTQVIRSIIPAKLVTKVSKLGVFVNTQKLRPCHPRKILHMLGCKRLAEEVLQPLPGPATQARRSTRSPAARWARRGRWIVDAVQARRTRASTPRLSGSQAPRGVSHQQDGFAPAKAERPA